MIEEGSVKKIGRSSAAPGADAPGSLERPGAVQAQINWKVYPVDVLIRFRDEIKQNLPALSLDEISMEEEMLLQFHSLRALQNEVLNDNEIALNQRAQIANATASALSKLADLQQTLYSSERFKMIENLLVRALRKLPEEVAATFLNEYEAGLSALK